jgi:hypothetical protein
LQYTIISDIGTKSFWSDILCAHAAVLETGDRFDFSDPRSGLPGMDHYLALLALPGKAYPDAPGAASALAIGAALSCWIEQQPTTESRRNCVWALDKMLHPAGVRVLLQQEIH